MPGGKYSLNGEEFLSLENKTLTAFSVASGVDTIRGRAFAYCEQLQQVVLPEGVKRMGGMVFIDCHSLKSVTLPSTLKKLVANPFGTMLRVECLSPRFKVVDNALFTADGTVLIALVDDKVENYIVPDGVTRIAERAFYGCSSLKSVVLPDSLLEIGDEAFEGCEALQEITVGKNISFPTIKIDPWTHLLHPEQVYDNSGGNVLMIDRKAGTAVVCNQRITVMKRSKVKPAK